MKSDHKNSLWLAIQFFLSLLLAVIGLKLNLLLYGESLYSIWLLLLSVWGVGAVLDLGFGMSIVRFVAQNRSDRKVTNSIVSTSMLLFLSVGLVIFALLYGFAELLYFSNQKLIPANYIDTARGIFLILGCNFYFRYISIVLKSTFEGFNDYLVSSRITLIYNTLVFIFTLAVFILKLDLYILAIFYLISGLIQFILYYLSAMKKYEFLNIRIRNFDWVVIKKIASFSFSIQMTYFIGALLEPTIKYIIGNFHSRELIPTYEIARKFSSAVSSLFTFSFRNNLPKVSILKTQPQLRHFINTRGALMSKVGITYSAVIFGLFSFSFAVVFRYFYKDNPALVIFYMLAIAESINNAGFIFYMFIVGQGKALVLSLVQLSNIILTSVFLIVGFVYFNGPIGFFGLAAAGVFSNISLLFIVAKITDVGVGSLYARIGIYKLVVFSFSLSIMSILMNKFSTYWVPMHVFLFLSTVIVFRKDFIQLGKYIHKNLTGLKVRYSN